MGRLYAFISKQELTRSVARPAPRVLSELHRTARAYAAQGTPVFPCLPNSKQPATPNGFHDATTDLVQVDAWWIENPEFNIAFPPHMIGQSVVDLDGFDGQCAILDLEAQRGPLPETFVVSTPRDGRHLYFDGELPMTSWAPGRKRCLGEHIDTRGVGAYVLLPPSRTKDGVYAVLHNRKIAPVPEWMAPLLAKPERNTGAAVDDLDLPWNVHRARVHLKGLAARGDVAIEGSGGDNRTFELACEVLSLGVSPEKTLELMAEHWNPSCRPPWTHDDLAIKIANAAAYAQDEPGTNAVISAKEVFAPAIAKLTAENENQEEPFDLFGDASIAGEPVLERDMLPDTIAAFAFDAAERLGVEPSMVAIPALAVCAAALDDAVTIQPRVHDTQWTESARLWFAMVADPGSRKTPASNAALKPLREIETRWRRDDAVALAKYQDKVEDRKAARRGRSQAIVDQGADLVDGTTRGMLPLPPEKPAQRQIIVTDFTMESLAHVLADNPRGVFSVQDELTGFFGSFDAYHAGTGKDRSAALELWNGGARQINRVKADGSISVQNWSASVLGGIQPAKLREIASKLTTDGLLQRFQPFLGRTLGPGIDRVPDNAALGTYSATLRRLVEIQASVPPKAIELTPEAHAYREEIERIADAMVALPTTPDALKNHMAKWPSLYARLLITLHAIERASGPDFVTNLSVKVEGSTARAARDLMVKFFLPHAVSFYEDFFRTHDPDGRHARWIAGYILTRKLVSITLSVIKEAYRELEHDEDAIRRAMETLQRARWVGEATKPRKDAIQWPVNSLVHERFAERAETERIRREQEKSKITEAAKRVAALKNK